MLIRHVVLVVVLSFCLGPDRAAAVRFSGLGDLPGGAFLSRANAISHDGKVVVGESSSDDERHPSWDPNEAFRWMRETGIEGLGDFDGAAAENGVYSRALDVSADGAFIVGQADRAGTRIAARWASDGSILAVNKTGDPEWPGVALGVSADGAYAVGRAGYQGVDARWHIVPGTNDITHDLLLESIEGKWGGAGDISGDGQIVVGRMGVGPEQSGVMRWTLESGLVSLGHLRGSGLESFGRAVSENGSTIVGSTLATDRGPFEAFRWTQDEGMKAIGLLTGDVRGSSAVAVSADGSVIAGELYVGSNPHLPDGMAAFVWHESTGIRFLADVLRQEGVDLTGWHLREATGVSGAGNVIVGNGINPDGHEEAWIAEIRCDLTHDWRCTAEDIDVLSLAVREQSTDPRYDLNEDGLVDADDRAYWVHDEKRTYFGDSNLDRQFNSYDMVGVFWFGQYEDAKPGNSTWMTGDWNGDAEFTSADMVIAFQDGGYEMGPRPVAAVPEPTTPILVLTMVIIGFAVRNRHASPRKKPSTNT